MYLQMNQSETADLPSDSDEDQPHFFDDEPTGFEIKFDIEEEVSSIVNGEGPGAYSPGTFGDEG